MPKKGCYEDITGRRFGMLVALEYAGQKHRRRTYWKCQCDCGNIAIVQTVHLKSGHTSSCGCKMDIIHKNIAKVNYVNGLSQDRIGRIYHNMINRCRNSKMPMYKYYGALGITFCDEWEPLKNGFKNFCDWAFQNGYSEKLTLDRIDPNGNYEPSNCRWVDLYVQANNKRKTKRYSYKGEELTISEISRKYNIGYFSLYSRVERLGWDIKKAVETPIVLGRNQFSEK